MVVEIRGGAVNAANKNEEERIPWWVPDHGWIYKLQKQQLLIKPNRLQREKVRIKIIKVNMTLQWKPVILDYTAARLAQLDKRRYAKQEVEGSNPGQTNTRGLKITKETLLLLQWHLQTARLSSLLAWER